MLPRQYHSDRQPAGSPDALASVRQGKEFIPVIEMNSSERELAAPNQTFVIYSSHEYRYMGVPAIFSDMREQKGHSAFSTYCATLHHWQRVFNDEERMLGQGYKA